MRDARTPEYYFQKRNKLAEQQLKVFQKGLEDLEKLLDKVRLEKAKTKAHKTLKQKKIEVLKNKEYHQRGRKYAMDIVNKVVSGDDMEVAEAVREFLDYKAYVRSEPHLKRTGGAIRTQVFRPN